MTKIEVLEAAKTGATFRVQHAIRYAADARDQDFVARLPFVESAIFDLREIEKMIREEAKESP